MTVEILEPRGPSTPRRTVLLTGASGVVGRALLDRLPDMDVICLVHRRPVTGPSSCSGSTSPPTGSWPPRSTPSSTAPR
jgi:hypothetical protein